MKEGEHRPVIVVPTNRPEKIVDFLKDWDKEFDGCHVILVFDLPEVPLATGFPKDMSDFGKKYILNPLSYSLEMFCWVDIDTDLGKDAWIIPRRTDCVRSYGFLKALEHNPLFILTLDDDTKPEGKTIEDHYKILFDSRRTNYKYYNTMTEQVPRGYFKDLKDIWYKTNISHGIWLGTPDLDAHEQLTNYEPSYEGDFNRGIIPKGSYTSTCGMNLAFRPEVTKYLYFGLQGQEYPIDRCGDIWAGYYASQQDKVLIATGYAMVNHLRASNPWTNLKKEKNAEYLGYIFREYFCEKPDKEIEDWLDEGEYFKKLREAYKIWERLCEERYDTQSK